MTSLEATILKEQLYCFMKFLEVNEFIDLQNFMIDDVTKDELIDSIVLAFHIKNCNVLKFNIYN